MHIFRFALSCIFILALTAICRLPVAHAEEVWDPIEPVNRGVFWFNDKLDVGVLEPVATFYRDNVGQKTRKCIGNFFSNLRYPRYLASDLIQLKFEQAGLHTRRFLLNSTLGMVGFFDIASEIGLEDNYEDVGLALAYWGVPSGPYIVLPLLGPSNLRDTVGTAADTFLDPIGLLEWTGTDSDVAFEVGIGYAVARGIHQRSTLLDAVDAAKESSVDYYLFVQSAYYQYRRGQLYDGSPPDEEEFDDSADAPSDPIEQN